MNSQPIGIFDSGVGGLTVAKGILEALPKESIVYIGDTARVPYGTRGIEIITQFATELVQFLLKHNVKILVAACNTISATCLDKLQENSPVPVIGVIKPAVLEASKTTRNKKVGVIGTRAIVNSKIYEKEIAKLDSEIEVLSQVCPLFVPIAEEGMGNNGIAKLAASQYLDVFNEINIDTLILGCTHYPLLREVIQEVVGIDVTLVDSAHPTARDLKAFLEENNLLNAVGDVTKQFFVTDAPERVREVADVFLGCHVVPALEKVTL
ncbi:MAG: glutamate racemase [Candidatus Blackburnbacteria bacterium]|nr:glutamate racemase [Candidatus Blackburnbacteria bacterium]